MRRFLTLILIFFTTLAAEGNSCMYLFSNATIEDMITSLAQLRIQIDRARADDSKALAISSLDIDFKAKEDELIRVLSPNSMTREAFREKLKTRILEIQNIEKRKRIQESMILEERGGKRAVLHRINPGSFVVSAVKPDIVTLTQPYDMMATPTTQTVWREIADLANAKLGSNIDISPSRFKGDLRPVESVSYEEVEVWLDALNKLSKMGEPRLAEIITGHKPNDFYRLPTEAEWKFMARGREQLKEDVYFENLGLNAWFKDNSGNTTHDVGEKAALFIDGNEFYDVIGNVEEWTSTWVGDDLDTHLGGVDPAGPTVGKYKFKAGGAFFQSLLINDTALISYGGLKFVSHGTGFRFLREVRNP